MASGTKRADRSAPAMAGSVSRSVSTVSNRGALSSCRSRLYPVGSPLISIRSVVRDPSSRADLPLASSATSGLRFCGIRLEPVLKPSESRTKPNSALVKSTRSSDNRDRLIPTMAPA